MKTKLMLVFTLSIVALSLRLAAAQSYSVIYNFPRTADGANPIGGVTVDAAGNLYGTTSAGGRRNFGNVFRLVHTGSSWSFYLLYTFRGNEENDGSAPYAPVTIGPDGALYGTTHSGGNGDGCRELHGCGTVFKVSPKPGHIFDPWEETLLHRFGTEDGSNPYFGMLVFDSARNIYGSTRNGGANFQGVIYELLPNGQAWSDRIVYSFAGPDGAYPMSGPTLDQSGNLWGATGSGGANGWGTVYRLQWSGFSLAETGLYSFQSGNDGAIPTGDVIVDAPGLVYAVNTAGGVSGAGATVQLAVSGGSNWDASPVHGFSGPGIPGVYRTLVSDRSGNMYGTNSSGGAYRQGSVFKLTRVNGTWLYSTLHDFTGGSDGGTPYGRLTFDAHGNLYGTASTGGVYGKGVVFVMAP